MPRISRPAGLAVGERSGICVAELQLFQLIQHLIQPQPLNELHHVIRHAVLFAEAEDRHDIGVVQPGGRSGLALESPLGLGVEQPALG